MDWPKMMLEEVLDGLVYTSAEIIKNGDDKNLLVALDNLFVAGKAMVKYIESK